MADSAQQDRDGFSAMAMGLAVVAPLLAFWLAAQPRDGQALAVYAGPDEARAMEVIARAEGFLVGFTSIPGLVIARSPSNGFAARLSAAGALLAIDAFGAVGCPGVTNSQPVRKDNIQ